MIVYSRVVFDMTKPDCPVVERVVWNPDYRGPVALCKTSSEEKGAAAQTQTLANTMSAYYGQTFAGQQDIIKNLKSSVDSLVAAGPGQYGFTAAEDAALRTQASAGTAGNYRMASQAIGEKLAAQGGGNQFLPSGTKDQIEAQTALAAAQSESDKQLGVTEAGYAQGRQNFETGLREETALGQMEDPTAYGGQASQTQQGAFGQFREMANDPGSLGILGGVLGSVAGAAVGGWASGCPAEGSLIKMANEAYKLVQDLKIGDFVMGIDGQPDEITRFDITTAQPVWKLHTSDWSVLVSGSHSFCRIGGGYVYAFECSDGPQELKMDGVSAFPTAELYGTSVCYRIETKRTHAYCVNGFWSLT